MVRGGRDEAGGGVSRKRREGVDQLADPGAGGDRQGAQDSAQGALGGPRPDRRRDRGDESRAATGPATPANRLARVVWAVWHHRRKFDAEWMTAVVTH